MAVVVGFIPTPIGFAALEVARQEAERRGGPLILVNVIRDGVTNDPRHADDIQLERAQDMLRHSSVRIAVRQERTDEDIAEVLLEVVEEESAELLVVGLRREKDMAPHMLGITLQKLLVSSSSDVLVV